MKDRIVDELDADAARDPVLAGLRTGRVLRAGDVARAAREAVRAWWVAHADAVPPSERAACDAVAKTAATIAKLAGGQSAAAEEILDAIEARDDGESWVVALGFAALAGVVEAAPAEARVARALRAVDATAEPLEHDVAAALRALPRDRLARLARLARLDATPWWLDAIAAQGIDARAVLAALPSPSARSAARVLRVRRESIARPTAMLMGGGEPGGLDAVLERPLGEPVATLFDDEIEVFAFGLEASDDGPPGLLVRQRDGDIDRIESVALDPPGPAAPLRSRVDLAWWVPLSGTADAARALVVRYRRERTEEATLAIEPE